MPTYEYRCKNCGEHLEVVQSFRDAPLTECPRCSGVLRKVFQPIGIAFKGSGFYRNDSRAGDGSKAGSAAAKANGSSGTGSSESSRAGGSSEGASSAKETATASSEAKSA